MWSTPTWATNAPASTSQPPVAEAPAFVGQIAQSRPQFGFRRPTGPIADHLAIGADDETGPPLRQAHHSP
jgi:hypothetical protein